MKKTDLEKNKGLKIRSKMNLASIPGRFGVQSSQPLDKREQRKRDQELGLVPFAVKLKSELVKQLHEEAEARQISLSELVGELLHAGMQTISDVDE